MQPSHTLTCELAWARLKRRCEPLSLPPCGQTPGSDPLIAPVPCWGQSYVTLPPTRVDPQTHPVGRTLGVYTCGPQSYVTLPPARVDPNVPRPQLGLAVREFTVRIAEEADLEDAPTRRVSAEVAAAMAPAQSRMVAATDHARHKHRARPKFGLSAAGGLNDFARCRARGKVT